MEREGEGREEGHGGREVRRQRGQTTESYRENKAVRWGEDPRWLPVRSWVGGWTGVRRKLWGW